MPQSKKKVTSVNLSHLLLLVFAVIIFGIITAYDYSKRNRSSNQFISRTDSAITENDQNKLAEIKIGDKIINAELANTDALRQRGLSYRENLEENSGVLFIFDTPQIPFFWMKDMNFPLDIIWINENTIVGIDKNVPFPDKNTPLNQLPKYSPKEKVNYVLEVNAGFTDNNGIEVGDSVNIQL